MSNRFRKLRNTICATATEMTRFRELAINAVMATDIVDKDLKQLRNNRWDKAFKKAPVATVSKDDDSEADEEEIESTESKNRKATIVIEHLIQASDVSHTMQHWQYVRAVLFIFVFSKTDAFFLFLQCLPKMERKLVPRNLQSIHLGSS